MWPVVVHVIVRVLADLHNSGPNSWPVCDGDAKESLTNNTLSGILMFVRVKDIASEKVKTC